MSDDTLIAGLLVDARKVAKHGRVTGLLIDHPLYAAIERVEALSPATWSRPEVTALQLALADASRIVGAESSLALMTGWDPTAALVTLNDDQRSAKVIRGCLIVFAVCLMFVTEFYTVWHKRATDLLNEMAATERDRQDLILSDLVIRYAAESTSRLDGNGAPGGLAGLAVFEKVGELRRIESRLWVNQGQLAHLQGADFPLKRQLREWEIYPSAPKVSRVSTYWDRVSEGLSKLTLSVRSLAAPETAQVDACAWKEKEEQPIPATRSASVAVPGDSAGRVEFLSEILAASVSVLPPRQLQLFRNDIETNDRLVATFRCVVGLPAPPEPYRAVLDNGLTQFVHQVEVLGVAWLPAFYGILGSVLFFLRRYLNPLHPSPPASRVLLRLCVAGLVGILVGWIWTPTEMFAGTEVAVAPISKLIAAFLAGFSIDVFFNLLDRLVVIGNGSIARMGDRKAT
jgi:hypothetical protein